MSSQSGTAINVSGIGWPTNKTQQFGPLRLQFSLTTSDLAFIVMQTIKIRTNSYETIAVTE